MIISGMNRIAARIVPAILAATALASSAFADTGAWRVAEMRGAVRLAQGGAQQISTGADIAGGAVLSTGMDGRVTLVRGEQRIVVGPNSRMSLPATEEPGMTRILQDMGTLLFKVDKRDRQHFRVETPVIAAVVKGTTFTVTAGADGHAVHVAEGAVEVSAFGGDDVELVTSGLTAFVSAASPGVIEMSNRSHAGVNPAASRAASPVPAARQEERAAAAPAMLVPAAIGATVDFSHASNGLLQDNRSAVSGAVAIGASQTNFISESRAGVGNVVRNALSNAVAGGESGNGLALGVGKGGNGAGPGLGGGNGDDGAEGDGNAGGNGLGLGLGLDAGEGEGLGLGVEAGAGEGGPGLGLGVEAGAGEGGPGLGLGVEAGAGDGGLGLGLGVEAGAGDGGPGLGLDVGLGGEGGLGLGVGAGAGEDGGLDLGLGQGGGKGLGLGLGLRDN